MSIENIATEYFGLLGERAQEAERVAMTVRVPLEVKERIERIAKEMDQSASRVAADLLEHGSFDLASIIGSRFVDKAEMVQWLVFGERVEKGEGK